MKIAIGSDHNGVKLKSLLKKHLESRYEVVDVGPEGEESVDYPDFAFAAAEMVGRNDADRAILICGSGIGMSMAANKVRGVRAALCDTPESARLTRQHNDANVLTLAGWREDQGDITNVVDSFLETEFEGGRHARRVGKMTSYEEESC
ncbi:MAG: ribose 5-phosphate isomerase B [Candidatus Krumholzibacteriota bacterium]|nr:ribose 5-phosphate isomerase B [Candidatus Krumholzibacteriota bacterium]